MPCLSGNGDEDYKESLDKVTRLLCACCRQIEKGKTPLLFGELAEWWKRHKKIDAARLEREIKERKLKKLREAALAKLTPAEQKLLRVRPEDYDDDDEEEEDE